MDIINVNVDNIESEHICCAISKSDDCQIRSKKDWLKARMADGLVFKKCDVRGKCFIEYIPAENAWAPIHAEGYMYIDCLWVSGQFASHGYSSLLLDDCIKDSKDKGAKGLCVLSSRKKLSFLSDSKYLIHKGFSLCDSALPYFELYYLPFDSKSETPVFLENAKAPHVNEKGFVLYYTNQCPFTAKYVPIIEDYAKSLNLAFSSIPIQSKEQAQSAPTAYTTYTLFYNGEFVTHEILSIGKFEKLAQKLGAI